MCTNHGGVAAGHAGLTASEVTVMSWLLSKGLRSFVLLAAAASLLLNVALLMPALYMMQVFDRVFASGSVETLVMLSAITLLFLVLSWFLDVARTRSLGLAGRSLERLLSPAALRGALEQASSGVGRADADALRDIAQLRGLLGGSGILALFDAPWLPVYLLVIALMHPWLGLVAAVGAVVLAALGLLNDRLTRGHADTVVRRTRGSTRRAEALARNAEVIVGMGMTLAAIARWQQDHDELLRAQDAHGQRAANLAALARATRQVLQVATLGIGAWLVIGRHASPGVMIAATVLLGRALQPVEHLIGGWRVLVDARGAWRRMGERHAAGSAEPRVGLPAPTGTLEVERVTFAVAPGRPPLLRNLGFALAAGDSLGLVGPSASGKTTLVRLILGLRRPQSGTVRLDGADVSRWDRDALGPHVGYLPQDVELFAGTVGENIARFTGVAGEPASERIVRAARRAHAHDMILQLPDGYDTQVGDAAAALSGGQRQRIALARALYGEPRLVVLDEPNANLDAAGEAALLATLADLKTDGVTVVMVTHNPTFTAALDKLAVLKNGVLEMFGPSAAVQARLHGGTQPARVVAFPPVRPAEALS
ncbi:MAG TPA: type I secretion system permease/ATPase [Steroidobacteraceae bacterium]|nr:type I secretion system permease/ATPase [Steroidobacteraceae bacterium]